MRASLPTGRLAAAQPMSHDSSPDASTQANWVTLLAFGLALAVPPLWAYSQTPSPTMLNQIWAVLGWGACLVLAWGRTFQPALLRAAWPLVAGVSLCALAALGSWAFGRLPLSLALPPFLLLGAAVFVALEGARQGATSPAPQDAAAGAWQPFEPMAMGLVVAGTGSAIVATIQVFFPQWIDGDWAEVIIARSGLVGRAVGNMRQPNHLASVLLWGLIALVPLAQWRPRLRPLLAACGVLMMLGVLLSASRTGSWIGFALLFAWGLVDLLQWALQRDAEVPRTDHLLPASVRIALLLVPVVWGLQWIALEQWAHSSNHVFGAAQRLQEHDLSSSRWGIWANTLAMIRQQPWTGTGWGEFNFAWTLTAFPGRPTAFFDHTHDLPLQLLVELGLPLGGLVIVLLLAALGLAGWQAWRVRGESGVGARAAFVVTLMILLHSLLEYPLWYSYFLLPAAFAWGFALGSGRSAAAAKDEEPAAGATSPAWRDRWSAPVGAAMFVLGLVAALNFQSVVSIYAPGEDDTRSLEGRISLGQRSWLYAHHADYADATSNDPPSNAHGAFDRATHSLLDTRLMTAWAKSLAAQGDLDRARYLAQRMLEFGREQSDGFFDACSDAKADPQPWQCLPPSRALTWRDFMSGAPAAPGALPVVAPVSSPAGDASSAPASR